MKAKKRLKALLADHVIYTDGYEPFDISDRLSYITEADGFFENDLEQQDKQTDDPLIKVEMEMLKMLGVHE